MRSVNVKEDRRDGVFAKGKWMNIRLRDDFVYGVSCREDENYYIGIGVAGERGDKEVTNRKELLIRPSNAVNHLNPLFV